MDWQALQQRTNAAVLAAFGSAIVLDGVSVQGDFHAPSDEVFLEGVSGMVDKPQVVIDVADLPATPVGLTCVVNGTSYVVADVRDDGHGLAVLMLQVVL